MAKLTNSGLSNLSRLISTALILLIKIYQLTRFIRPSCCRFYPSCSDYSAQALATHGIFKGIALTIKRLLNCHPWHPGGIDFLPARTYSVLTCETQRRYTRRAECNEGEAAFI